MGATTSVSRPLLIASQAPSCAGVGAAKAPVNHARVAGEKRSRAVTPTILPRGYDKDPPSVPVRQGRSAYAGRLRATCTG